MDDKITAVLDTYHAMIHAEQSKPRDVVGPGERDRRLRAVGPETGRLLNILARSLAAPRILEIGTSYGYSGIWLAEAARASGGRVITMELHGYKSAFAREMAAKAGLADHIEFQVGDAVKMIAQLNEGIDFVLLDLEKDLYVHCLEAFYPKLRPSAIIVADNMLRPMTEAVKRYAETVRALHGITSVMLPVGMGIEVSRFDPG